ncbi:MAG: DUF2497 domain-containing protein [Pseudomonadota bacterium]
MEDLMASIRKIISEDYGPQDAEKADREATWSDDSADHNHPVEPAGPRMSAHAEHDLSGFVAQSVRDALAQQPMDEEPIPPLEPTLEDAADEEEHSLALGVAIAAGSAAHHEAEKQAARYAADRRAASVAAARRMMPEGEPDLVYKSPKRRPPRADDLMGDQGPEMSPRERLRALAATARKAEDASVAAEPGESIAVAAPHTAIGDEVLERGKEDAAPQGYGRLDHGDDGLTSIRTRHNVATSFDTLSRTILTNNPRTLEDLVRDMVRPLLREWIDANLGTIVERQVRQEIDRMSGRGR